MRVAIVYHYFALYRKPVFERLQCNSNSKFKFFGGTRIDIPNLKLIDFSDEDLDFCHLKNSWFFGFLWQHGLFSGLKEFKPDTIIFLGQYNFISTWILSIIYRFKRVKVIFWGHGYYGNESGLKSIVRKVFNRLPNKHLVYGHHAKNLMLKHGDMYSNKIDVIYNSLNYEMHTILYYDLLRRNNKADFAADFKMRSFTEYGVFIGRLTPVKKLEQIIISLSKIKDIGYCNLGFVFIGDGPEMSSLKRLSQQLKIDDKLIFVGESHDESLNSSIIFNARVCVSPGNIGLTAIHSLSYGTPVITHNDMINQMPEAEAIVEGQTGTFFEVDSIDELSKAMLKYLLVNEHDRLIIRNECRRVIDAKYNPSVQSNLILKAIED